MISSKKKIAYLFACALTLLYLLWRVFFTIPWHTSFWLIGFALLLVICEIISNITAYIVIFFRLRVSKKHPSQNLEDVPYPDDQPVPAVDVVIVTHDEPVDLLQKTVNAAKKMHYPNQQVTICLADDGNRPEVAQLAANYGVTYEGFENNHEAKSGNINHALEQLSAPLLAIFDADMIPYSGFLNATVPIFMQNWQTQHETENAPRLGFVQTPQSFYNADIFQFNLFSENIVPNEQDYFSRDINVLNSANGAAIFTGSNTLFLREAVDAAGGFPTDTVTEDFELGGLINAAGYVSYSTQTPQASGVTPLDIKGVIKQRRRWARGVIQSCQNLHVFTNTKFSFVNKLVFINSYFYWWSFLRRLVFIIAPILFALFNQPVVLANFWLLMCFWAPGYFMQHWVLGDTAGPIRNERWGEVQETFFAPFIVMPVILETLRIKQKKFTVTEKESTYSWRDRIFMLPYLILWLLTLAALIKFNYGKFGSEILMGSVITFWLLTHFVNLTFCLFIASGRPFLRNAERFGRQVKGQLEVGRLVVPLETVDMADHGVKFITPTMKSKVVEAGQHIALDLTGTDGVPIQVHGLVVRVIELKGQFNYAVRLTDTGRNVDEQNEYLHLIYDGFNGTLSVEQDRWITPLDELWMNIALRFEQWQKSFNRRHETLKQRGSSK